MYGLEPVDGAAIWLRARGVEPRAARDLIRWVGSPGWESVPTLSGYGSAIVLPFITVAPFVENNVTAIVCAAMREIGEPSAAPLIEILARPLFDEYWDIVRQSKLSDDAKLDQALYFARVAYANALEGLAELVGRLLYSGVRPWYAEVRARAAQYMSSDEINLRSPAISLCGWVDMEIADESRTYAPREEPRAGSIAGTGWAKSVAAFESESERTRANGIARQRAADAMAHWFYYEQWRKGH